MPEEVVHYVTQYGYLAIFVLVFLQEIGLPNPFPNELLLMFSGYLSFKRLLFLPYVIMTAITADFIGTDILYFLFLNTGALLIQKKPKWVPLSARMISQLAAKISKGGLLSIYLFRLTPFTRGYASVITGLLQVKPKAFLPVAIISAVTWSAIYVLAGYLIGPSWDLFTSNLGSFKYIMLSVFAVLLFMVLLGGYIRRKEENRKAEIDDSAMN